jgi:hypothetical protein
MPANWKDRIGGICVVLAARVRLAYLAVSLCETGCCANAVELWAFCSGFPCRTMAMEHWLDIPKDRKTLPVWRLCLIMALVVMMMMGLSVRKTGQAVQRFDVTLPG